MTMLESEGKEMMIKDDAMKLGASCNDCFFAMQNCHDMAICCEDETALCDWFEPTAEFGHKTSDFINRFDAIKAIDDDIMGGLNYESILEELPAADVRENVRGKWLPDNNNYYEERFICSVCGRSYKVDTCMGKPMWDFCPCGADMRNRTMMPTEIAATIHYVPFDLSQLTEKKKKAIEEFNKLTAEEKADIIEVDGRQYVRKIWEKSHPDK